jgi:hypothetical protein
VNTATHRGFGICPQCINISDARFVKALTLHDHLHPAQLLRMVAYPTQFCCKGVGYQSLMATELAHAYGLPIVSRL